MKICSSIKLEFGFSLFAYEMNSTLQKKEEIPIKHHKSPTTED